MKYLPYITLGVAVVLVVLGLVFKVDITAAVGNVTTVDKALTAVEGAAPAATPAP